MGRCGYRGRVLFPTSCSVPYPARAAPLPLSRRPRPPQPRCPHARPGTARPPPAAASSSAPYPDGMCMVHAWCIHG
eukprot:scaffold13272_cov36-Phaeocystis_antarctica.AAC.2